MSRALASKQVLTNGVTNMRRRTLISCLSVHSHISSFLADKRGHITPITFTTSLWDDSHHSVTKMHLVLTGIQKLQAKLPAA